jgi:hypothetical protein
LHGIFNSSICALVNELSQTEEYTNVAIDEIEVIVF